MMRHWVAGALAAAIGPVIAVIEQAPSVAPRASISGIVVTTDDPPRPMSRAVVSLWGDAHPLGFHGVTDEQGRFEIAGVAPGRYSLSAARASYVSIEYGAVRPGWPGTAIALAAGQSLADITLRLVPGAVITGTVRTVHGESAPDTEVHVERVGASGGSARRVTAVTTDDQGVYRAFGLAAGAYIVSARPAPAGVDAVAAYRDADVDEVLRRLRDRVSRSLTSPALVRPLPVETSAQSDLVPVYYGGAFSAEDAMPVVVRAGEEKVGIDIGVTLMTTSTLLGRLAAPGLAPSFGPGALEVVLVRAATRRSAPPPSARVQADGTFRFGNVVPGTYRVVARRWPGEREAAATAVTAPAACQSGSSDVTIGAGGVHDVIVELRPCVTVVGHVRGRVDDTTQFVPVGGVQVALEPDLASDPLAFVPLRAPALTSSDGRFVLGDAGDALPGRYVIRIDESGEARRQGWFVESVSLDGRDVLDQGLHLTAATPAVVGMVVTLTRRTASLSGRLDAADSRPAPEFTVIAFTANRAWWRPPFRHVMTTRPDNEGQYRIEALPPGEYYVAALTEMAPDEWLNAAVLDEIVRAAVRVTIGAGEAKVLGLRIAGSPKS